MLASRHKDIHGSVSKVGKAIDRVRTGNNIKINLIIKHVRYTKNHLWNASLQNFDAEISAVVAETVWDTPERQKYLSETIVEHLYRQGMLSVAEDLCQVINSDTFNLVVCCCLQDCAITFFWKSQVKSNVVTVFLKM